MINIDVTYDFTSDTKGYWYGYWERDPLFGGTNRDPDNSSKTMQLYHRFLYSKPLPNGETMELKIGTGANYLYWNNFRFGSDSIIASFRYQCYRQMIDQVSRSLPNYREYMENFVHRSYTLGGGIIFPKRKRSINQARGLNRLIRDRWDLTLECIRRFYAHEESPLSTVLEVDRNFFELFFDFKGYVDYFYLQDCVSDNYRKVNFWIGDGSFEVNPFPKSVNEYLQWIENQLCFIEQRNNRIQHDIVLRNL